MAGSILLIIKFFQLSFRQMVFGASLCLSNMMRNNDVPYFFLQRTSVTIHLTSSYIYDTCAFQTLCRSPWSCYIWKLVGTTQGRIGDAGNYFTSKVCTLWFSFEWRISLSVNLWFSALCWKVFFWTLLLKRVSLFICFEKCLLSRGKKRKNLKNNWEINQNYEGNRNHVIEKVGFSYDFNRAVNVYMGMAVGIGDG